MLQFVIYVLCIVISIVCADYMCGNCLCKAFGAFVFGIFAGVIVEGYLLPTLLAFDNGIDKKWHVALVNIILGWTLVGYFAAIAMVNSSKETV